MIHEEFFNFIFTHEGLSQLLEVNPSSKEWINLIDNILQKISYARGNIILPIGQIPEHIFFLLKGAVRAYYLDDDNQAHTLYLWSGHAIITDISHYLKKKPSDLHIEVHSDSELIVISRFELDRIISQYPEAQKVLTAIVLILMEHHRQRDKDSQTLSAKERLEKYAGLGTTLQQTFARYFVASFFGMSRAYSYEVMSKKKKGKGK